MSSDSINSTEPQPHPPPRRPRTKRTAQRNPRPRVTGYPPLAAATFKRRLQFLEQAEARLQDPHAPDPDVTLLAGGEHGPFTSVFLAPDPDGGRAVVNVTTKDLERGPRRHTPEGFLMLDFLTAWGGGFSRNHNGKGLAYDRLYGDRDRIQFGRLLTGAGEGEMAMQQAPSGERLDHHNQEVFTKVPAAAVARPDRPMRPPGDSREKAVRTAIRLFTANRHRAPGIKVTEAEYRAILVRVFRLVDALNGPHRTRTGGSSHGAA